MLFGIAASQDCKLRARGLAWGEPIRLQKAAERLSRHLAAPGLGQRVEAQLVAQAGRRIGPETLIVTAPTDLRETLLFPVKTGASPDQALPGNF